MSLRFHNHAPEARWVLAIYKQAADQVQVPPPLVGGRRKLGERDGKSLAMGLVRMRST